MMIKNVKLVEFNTKIVSAFSNTQTHDLIQYKCLCCNKNYQKKFNKNLNNFLIHTNFLTMISISLFSCCEYMHNLEKFNISLPEKEDFYSPKQYNIVSWSIWKLSKYVSWNIWAHFLCAPWVAWQAALKKTKLK